MLPLLLVCATLAQAPFTLEQIKSYPFPNELTASGNKLAWAVNEQGRRNIYVAEGPDYKARRLTNYTQDDGQELTSLAISNDGKYVVAVRGGEHGSNWDVTQPVNPASLPTPFRVQILSIPFSGGEPKVLAEGDLPEISPNSSQVLFSRQGSLYLVPIDGSKQAKSLLTARGTLGQAQWSPDGKQVAFVSNRTTHSMIGIYSNDTTPILWISPTISRDSSPRWSPDGKGLAFIRMPAQGGEPRSALHPEPNPWSIHIANASTGEAKRVWSSGNTPRDSYPTTHGQANLHWAAKGRIVFLSYADGHAHLYSIPEQGGTPLQLTKGNHMNEYISLSPDKTYLLSTANTGNDDKDIDRRHILKIPVDQAKPELLTSGKGLEWTAVATDDTTAYIATTPQNPPMVTVLKNKATLAAETLPANFPAQHLVTPEQVTFKAPDGTTIHGQLFVPKGGPAKKPALVYVHGGPPRQMLLGWHYGDYYANAYATNQFLASRGFIVLSVNYRLGIGYGYEFHQATNGGARGASEYGDVKAAGEFLHAHPAVNNKAIGIYGGSYGGYLTALALARDSALFAAGVDIHGVHNRFIGRNRGSADNAYEKTPDLEASRDIAWRSNPVASLDTWKSPVLLIHGDDDRNVEFIQTVDLLKRLEKRNVEVEHIVIPDDTHHFLKHTNWLKIAEATADFFKRKLN
ncbi:MAG: S9 family peptidase [Acidobacteria bacterium]|nr:S9 family peptidase [Acidobacteriota bacterium]